MTLKEFNAYCLAKPGVEANYPFKGDTVWMKVMGKMFAMTNVRSMKMNGSLVEPFHFINLKCHPEQAIALRQEYPAIKAGWHQSKTHWNSLYMDGSLPDKLILELTDHAYELVKGSLSKKLLFAVQNL